MALVGEAHIIVRAITSSISKDIERGFSGASGVGSKAGANLGKSFSSGFKNNSSKNIFSKISADINNAVKGAERAREAFSGLARAGQFLGATVAGAVGGLSALIGGIGALGGAAGGAIGSVAALGNVLFALGSAMAVAKLALGGVGKALKILNKPPTGGGAAAGGKASAAAAVAAAKAREAAAAAVQSAEKSLALTIESNRESLITANNDVRDAQLSLNAAIAAGREEIQQLGFDAEDAALSEKKASLDLEKARLALAKAQDLPPNSRVRQEAELAYQEAELNYRKAKDKSADLNKEQDRLAKTGIAGTQGVIDATNALAQAEANKSKTVRDAARSEADAQDSLAKAKKDAATAGQGGDSGGGASGGGGGGADPFAKLNAAQIAFVKFIQSLKPQFDELKKIAAESFLPPLTEAITLLSTQAFPTIAKGVGIVGAALGQATISIASAIVEGRNLNDLGKLFASTGPLLETMGKALGQLYGVVLQLLVGSAPQAQRFFDFVNNGLTTFNNYLRGLPLEGPGSLSAFFQRSGDLLAQFGRIFGNIFGGFGAIIMANFGPGSGGQIMLDWLEQATQKFADLDSTTSKADGLNTYFQGAATNSAKVLGAIGALLGGLIALGGNAAIGQTFDALKVGAPAVVSITKKLIEAGPAFGAFVSSIVRIIDLLTDTDTTKFFFSTLETITTAVADFLSGPFVTKVLAVIAPFQGMALAIGLVGTSLLLGGKIIFGYISLISGAIGSVLQFVKVLNPWIIVIGLVVAAFIYLYNTSDTFKAAIDSMLQTLGATFSTVFAQIASVVGTLIPIFATLLTSVVDTLVPVLIPVLITIAQAFTNIISAVLPLIGVLISTLIPVFVTLVTAILPVISTIIDLFIPVFVQIINAVLPVVVTIVQMLIPVLATLIAAIGPVISTIIKAFIPVFSFLISAIVPVVTLIMTQVLPALLDLFKTIQPVIQTLIDALIPAFNQVIKAIIPLLPVIVNLITSGLQILVPIFKLVIGVIAALIPIVLNVVKAIADFLLPIITAIIQTLAGLIQFITGVFTGNWSQAWNGIISVFRGIANIIVSIFEGMLNYIINGLNGITGAINGVLGAIKTATGGAVNLSIGKIPGVRLPRLAKGGTVFPSAGGSIVNVAEAGKPERIEPLDANGLSNRDKALITQLSGGGGGGTTINVYATPGMDISELANEIDRRISFNMRKGGVA